MRPLEVETFYNHLTTHLGIQLGSFRRRFTGVYNDVRDLGERIPLFAFRGDRSTPEQNSMNNPLIDLMLQNKAEDLMTGNAEITGAADYKGYLLEAKGDRAKLVAKVSDYLINGFSIAESLTPDQGRIMKPILVNNLNRMVTLWRSLDENLREEIKSSIPDYLRRQKDKSIESSANNQSISQTFNAFVEFAS